MYQSIKNFPEQFLKGWQLASPESLALPVLKSSRKIIYAGMGGSSLPGDLINDYLQDRPPFILVRNYDLPAFVGSEDLVLVASFSGNTEESLSLFQAARDRGCSIVVLTHGGELQHQALEYGIPWVKLPECIQPRCATGYFFASLLHILHRLGWVIDQNEILQDLAVFLQKHQREYETKGKSLAGFLKDRVPIIYGPSEFYSACRIWKIKLNENAKVPSFFNTFPELNHNEMVGFTQLPFAPTLIYLKSPQTHPQNLKRMEVMKELCEKRIPIFEILLSGESFLKDTFAALMMGDYVSYYLAQAYGVDPAPVKMVEDFKARLQERSQSKRDAVA